MHPQWNQPSGYVDASHSYHQRPVAPWQLEEAYQAAHAANVRLAEAEHRFARETEQLHTTIAAFEHSYQTLVVQNRELNLRVQRLQAELQGLTPRCEAAEATAREKTAAADRLAVTNAQLTALVRILRVDHETSELIAADLDHRCDELAMVHSDLQSVVHHQTHQIAVLQGELDEALTRNNSLETERENHLLQMDLMQSRLDDFAKPTQDHSEELNEVRAELQKTHELLGEQRAANRQLQSALQQSEAAATIMLSETQAGNEAELQRLQDEVETLTQTREQLQSQIKHLNEQLTQSRDQSNRVDVNSQHALRSVSAECDRLQSTVDRLAERLSQCETDLLDANAEIERKNALINDLNVQLEDSHAEMGHQTNENQLAVRQNAQLADQIASLQHAIRVKDSDLSDEWQRRFDQMESELVRARYQCHEQGRQLQAQATQFLQQASGLKRSRDLALQNSQAQAQRCAELENELRQLRRRTDDVESPSTQLIKHPEDFGRQDEADNRRAA
ncbi:hypothetical protein [Stieleria varia]|uniref:Chromosome partition protein Smc n=1 Tax=Stieleria varia TaxID=2528005 RepID=A0A5C6B739_9BACT|nr:hypothetical protein [Stieleria varia]TWU07587.1 Chromosome partition protein Smc [Stieleria varia]